MESSFDQYGQPKMMDTCFICGVKFWIGRSRRPGEPREAGWNAFGAPWSLHIDYAWECNDSTGCGNIIRDEVPRRINEESDEESMLMNVESDKEPMLMNEESDEDFDEYDRFDLEHVAGPGCLFQDAFSGYEISVVEMKENRRVQFLVPKTSRWRPEKDDQDFEIESRQCFLSGVGDYPNHSGQGAERQARVVPVKHGVKFVTLQYERWNVTKATCSYDTGIGFHPTCFEIFKRVSIRELGYIDIDGLWDHFWDEPSFVFYQIWDHAINRRLDRAFICGHGTEYLAANPINIPGYHISGGFEKWRPRSNSRSYLYEDVSMRSYKRREVGWSTIDSISPFKLLPRELKDMVLYLLSSRDIANQRLACPCFRELPTKLFRRFMLEELPWFWEAAELDVNYTDWPRLFVAAKFSLIELKGLKNRRRIWRHAEERLARIIQRRENLSSDPRSPETSSI